MVGCCISEGWREDTALLGGAYVLSLLSTWVCHKIRPRVAYDNLIVMIVYNEYWLTILSLTVNTVPV